MTYRKVYLANDEYYHIFNKSVGNTDIFVRQDNINRLFDLIQFYSHQNSISYSHLCNLSVDARNLYLNSHRAKSLVEIIAFSIMPNHYHFLLRQIIDGGISRFISNLQNSFAKYFNVRFDRRGALFCEMFKAVRIQDNAQLLHVSRYIHLNHVTAKIIRLADLPIYPLSSFCHYTGALKYDFITSDIILHQFKKVADYQKFVFDQADYQIKLNAIKKMLLD